MHQIFKPTHKRIPYLIEAYFNKEKGTWNYQETVGGKVTSYNVTDKKFKSMFYDFDFGDEREPLICAPAYTLKEAKHMINALTWLITMHVCKCITLLEGQHRIVKHMLGRLTMLVGNIDT